MEQEIFQVKQSALLRALIYGHFVNILVGIVVFGAVYSALRSSVETAIIATVASTTLVAIFISVLGTRKISKPISALREELHTLHEKISSSSAEVSLANETTQALLEDLPLGCLVFNKKLELTMANSSALKLLGLPQDEEHKEPVKLTDALSSVKINNKPLPLLEWINQSRTNTVKGVEEWSMATVEQADSRTGVDVIAHYNSHDSHNYELVILLVDKSAAFERREKEIEFISLAAHELRGPITIIRGLIDILQTELGDKISDQHKTLLTRLAVSSRQLAGYVDNILNASRVDKENFEVTVSEVNWKTFLEKASSDLNIRALAHHRKLVLQADGDLPTVAADPSAMLHVINNLVDNAIKYSPENGSVIIAVKREGDDIETTIQDSGIGIPASVIDNLFTKFYRSHKSKQFVSGTGLGLYLSKAIVEAHGGSIWVRSTEGVGTTFGFTIPTYETAKLNNKTTAEESGIIRGSHGWIKNHALYRR